MQDIEDEVRRSRRTRLLARGGASDYEDAEIYASVDRVLRRAIDGRNHDELLLPQILPSDDQWELATQLQFSSHRPLLGPFILAVKRRILLPLTRWLYQYTLDNFKRQHQVNRVLFACVEELAIENARLQSRIAGLQNGRIAEGTTGQEGRERPEGREGLDGQVGQERRERLDG